MYIRNNKWKEKRTMTVHDALFFCTNSVGYSEAGASGDKRVLLRAGRQLFTG